MFSFSYKNPMQLVVLPVACFFVVALVFPLAVPAARTLHRRGDDTLYNGGGDSWGQQAGYSSSIPYTSGDGYRSGDSYSSIGDTRGQQSTWGSGSSGDSHIGTTSRWQRPSGDTTAPSTGTTWPSTGTTSPSTGTTVPSTSTTPIGTDSSTDTIPINPPVSSTGSTTSSSTGSTPLTTGTTGGTCSVTGTSGGPSDTVLKGAFDLQNCLRAKHSAPAFTWSSSLQASAQQWADSCALAHSQHSGYNELIAWGNRAFTTAIMDEWHSEISKYNFANPPTSYDGATPHFTQVVWKSTTQVGCGAASCSKGGFFYVCHYAPTGNTGAYAANVAPAQSCTCSA